MSVSVPFALPDGYIEIYEEVTDEYGAVTYTLLFEYMYIQNLRLGNQLELGDRSETGIFEKESVVLGESIILTISNLYFSKAQSFTQAFDRSKKYRLKIIFDETPSGQYEVFYCDTSTPKSWSINGQDPNMIDVGAEWRVKTLT